MNTQPQRSNSLGDRVRRLSNTVMSTARNVLTGHMRTSSDDRFRYVVYGASHSAANLQNLPPRDEWKRYRNKARSTEDVRYRPTTQAPPRLIPTQTSSGLPQDRQYRPQPTPQPKPKPKSHSRVLEMRYGPQDGPSRSRPGMSPSSTARFQQPAQASGSGSRDHSRKKERPVLVPLPDYTQRRPEANVYQFPAPPSPLRDSMFAPFAPVPRSPALSAAIPDSPTLGVLPHSFAGVSAPTRGPRAPHRARPSPLTNSPTGTREPSVYCSTDAPTVRRHGAIRRTSSSGETNVPLAIQHARHRSDQRGEPSTPNTLRHNYVTRPTPATIHHRERQRPATPPPRTMQRPPAPSSPLRPTEPARERDAKAWLPDVKPWARDVPRDVEEQDSLLGTETPRSSLMLIPPTPVATTSMVAKVQGSMAMRMREPAGARTVKTVAAEGDRGGADLHRARSHRAEVSLGYAEPECEGSPRSTVLASTVGALVEGEGGRSERRKGKETMRRHELDAAEKRAGVAAWVNSLSTPTPDTTQRPTPQRAGTLPLNIRKKNGNGSGMNAAAGRR